MKRVLVWIIALALAVSSAAGFADALSGNSFASARRGDIVTFGSYDQDGNHYNGNEPIEWIVVETFSNCIKLVSRYALECMYFDSDTWPENWKSSEVRMWLNELFYAQAFSAGEQSLIDLALCHNPGNETYNVPDQEDTYDNVFLLNLKEVNTYFPTVSSRLCQPTLHAIANGAYVNDYSRTTWWWTRTPGEDLRSTIYVGNGGNIDYEGNPNNWANGCVRPALLVSTVRSSSGSTAPVISGQIYCPHCGRQIAAGSKFCMYCGYQITSSVTPSQNYGPWSEWTTTPIYNTAGREVQTRTAAVGYYMVHYGTQTAEPPYNRMFRDYSINGQYEQYGARDTYGEKHFTRYVSADLLNRAVTYAPGSYIPGTYAGYQEGMQTAYYFGDDQYVWFIESAEIATQYRWRSIY